MRNVWRNLTECLNAERCFCISAVPTPAVRAACQCAPSFRYFPRPRCCGLTASFPGQCASSGGRLPEELFMVFLSDSKRAKVCKYCGSFLQKKHKCKSCRPRQELSNEYLLAKIGFDTAENEPLKVCQKIRQHLEKSWNNIAIYPILCRSP